MIEKELTVSKRMLSRNVDINEVIEDYLNLPLEEAAAKYDVSAKTFAGWIGKLRKNKEYVDLLALKARKGSERSHSTPSTEEEILEFIEDFNTISVAEVMEKYGTARQTVYNWVRKYQQDEIYHDLFDKKLYSVADKNGKSRPSTEGEILSFINNYNIRNLADIALEYNVTPSTISRWASDLREDDKYSALLNSCKKKSSAKAPRTEEDIVEFITRFNTTKGTVLAEEYETSAATISTWAKEFRNNPKYTDLFITKSKKRIPDLPADKIDEIIDDYNNLYISEAAEKYGVSNYTYLKWIDALREDEEYKNLIPKKKPHLNNTIVSQMPKTPEEIEKFIEVYSTHNLRDAGKIYGVSRQSISNWANELKKDKRYAARMEKTRDYGYLPPLDFKNKNEKEKFIRYYAEHTAPETSEHYGISSVVVNRTMEELIGDEELAELYKHYSSVAACSETKPSTEEEIIEFLRLRLENTYEELAKIYNVHPSTVQRWTREFEQRDRFTYYTMQMLDMCEDKINTFKDSIPKTADEIKRCISIYNKNGTDGVATFYDVTTSSAQRWINTFLNNPDYVGYFKRLPNTADKTLADFSEGQILELLACYNNSDADFTMEQFGIKTRAAFFNIIRGLSNSPKYADLIAPENRAPIIGIPTRTAGESEEHYRWRRRNFFTNFVGYLNKCGSLTETAAFCQVSLSTCRNWYMTLQKEYPDLFEYVDSAIVTKRNRRPKTEEEINEFIGYYNTHTSEETAAHYNSKLPTIYSWVKYFQDCGYKEAIRSRRPRESKTTDEDVERFAKVYQEHSAKETAEILGLSTNTVQNRVYQYRNNPEYAHLFPSKK